jgi:hypothetical protein
MGRPLLKVGLLCAATAGTLLYFQNQGENIDEANGRVEEWLAGKGSVQTIGTWAVGQCANLPLNVRKLDGDEVSAIGRPSGPDSSSFAQQPGGGWRAEATDFRVPKGGTVRLAIGVTSTTPNVSQLATQVCRTEGGDEGRVNFAANLPAAAGSADMVLVARSRGPEAPPAGS